MKKITLLVIVLLSGVLSAQNTGEEDWGAWYMYFGTNTISDKFSLHTEAQFRYYETAYSKR